MPRDKKRADGNPGELSSADLLRECGQKLTNRPLWEEFQKRFHSVILMYVMRVVRRKDAVEVPELVSDLTQDVYIKLLRSNGQILKMFRGESDFSVRAFLAKVCISAVSDNYRQENAQKRQVAQVIRIGEPRPAGISRRSRRI
jgi:DNA-directed RNA polymerase specialized sigma24 family protein